MEKFWDSGELLLTIDQISHLAGISKSTLRYWERIFGDFLKPARTPTNRRRYAIEDLYRVKTIKQLMEDRKLTVHGMRLRLKEILATEREKEDQRQDKSKITKEKTEPSTAGNNHSVK